MIETFEQAALAAGRTILEVYEAGIHVTLKPDCSPVTEADDLARNPTARSVDKVDSRTNRQRILEPCDLDQHAQNRSDLAVDCHVRHAAEFPHQWFKCLDQGLP